MERNVVYFDHNSTTPLLPTVRDAMLDMMREPCNPSSMHHFGRAAKHVLEAARTRVLGFSGADDEYTLVFTSSGTEANNLAVWGLKGFNTLCPATEHVSVLNAVREPIIPVKRSGEVDLEALESICAKQTEPFLVSVMAANNETGVINPMDDVVRIVHKAGGVVHTDATQVFGKVGFDVVATGVDMATISAHKFGGPLGIGALIFRKKLDVQPIMSGGGQEFRRRPGTPNIPAIHGFGIAAELAGSSLVEYGELSKLRDHVERLILKTSPNSVVFGGEASRRLPNTLFVTMPNVSRETQIIYFDINGFAVSAGAACSSGSMGVPHVVMSMGYEEAVARDAIRISLGLDSNMTDVKRFIKAWQKLYNNSSEIKQVA